MQRTGKASAWHVGGVWRNPPFSIESLTYQAVPEIGGHTLWADLQAAYDDLSEPVKRYADGPRPLPNGHRDALTSQPTSSRSRVPPTRQVPAPTRPPASSTPSSPSSSPADLRRKGHSFGIRRHPRSTRGSSRCGSAGRSGHRPGCPSRAGRCGPRSSWRVRTSRRCPGPPRGSS